MKTHHILIFIIIFCILGWYYESKSHSEITDDFASYRLEIEERMANNPECLKILNEYNKELYEEWEERMTTDNPGTFFNP